MGPHLLKHESARMIRNLVNFYGVKNAKCFFSKDLNFFIFFGNSKIVSSQMVQNFGCKGL